MNEVAEFPQLLSVFVLNSDLPTGREKDRMPYRPLLPPPPGGFISWKICFMVLKLLAVPLRFDQILNVFAYDLIFPICKIRIFLHH